MRSLISNLIFMALLMVGFQNCGTSFAPLEAKISKDSQLDGNSTPDGEVPDPDDGGDPVVYPLNPVPAGAATEVIATNHNFTEGPAYHLASNTLYFSDLDFNDNTLDSVFRLNLTTGVKEIWKANANGSNGGMFDAQGNFYSLEGRTQRRVVRHNNLNDVTSIIAFPNVFNGQIVNAPNDLDILSNGSLYFTDPTYNTDPNDNNKLNFSGVFRVSSQGVLQNIITAGFVQPNGLAFSPDETTMYVSDSGASRLYAFDVLADGSVNNQREIFAFSQAEMDLGPIDGITIDVAGNLYLSGGAKISVLNSLGEKISEIPVGEGTANCSFGGLDNKTLFITSRSTVRQIELLIPGKPAPALGPSL